MTTPRTLVEVSPPMQKTLPLLLLGVLLATGCSGLRFPGVYRIDIEQGNIVDADMLEQLKPGLDPAQVRYVMGSPQLADPFTPERWVYLYRLRRGDGELVSSRIVLHFENDRLVRWEGEALPVEARRKLSTAAGATATTSTEAPEPL